MNRFSKYLRYTYNKITGSIAFYPAIIAIGFLFLSWLMLELDYSQLGKQFKSDFKWVRLKDATTALSIVSTIVGGVISLTVFSFSMVMILLNQAASQMSNRMLSSMIGNRFQQIILGFYIGTIVYALFLLSSIRNIDSGVYVPALSIYLLLLLTVGDIFLFIYFLHYVTQSVKFETIITRVHKKTVHTLNQICNDEHQEQYETPEKKGQMVAMYSSDYYQGFNERELIRFACEHGGTIQFLHPAGAYLLKGSPLLVFHGPKQLTEEDLKKIFMPIDLFNGQPLEKNPYYGYHQLAEVAIKALSPGINDPETAVLSIHALTDLFLFRLNHYIKTVFKDNNNETRVVSVEWNFEQLFGECFYPIWNYGKDDLYIQNTLANMLEQLMQADKEGNHKVIFDNFLEKLHAQKAENHLKFSG
ncbi:MAG: DUF2254 domain-containing protein [Bacteroidia bacterium]